MKSFVLVLFLLLGCTKLDENINAKQFKDLMSKKDYVVLDVRTPQEFSSEHLENAKNYDIYSSKTLDAIAKLDKAKTYLIYCRSGRRSLHMMNLMSKMGFKTHNLLKGINGWKEQGYPVVQ